MNSIVFVADQHTLCREALCDYIRHSDHELQVEGMGDYAALKENIQSTKPALVLISRDFPGVESLADLQADKVGLIVMTMEEDLLNDPVPCGIFPKTLSCKEFLIGIQEVLAGRTFYPPTSDNVFFDAPIKVSSKPYQDFGLTPREKEVATYLLKGQSNKDIARALGLQVVTVKLHVRGICRKMKAANRTQAALIAKESGWV